MGSILGRSPGTIVYSLPNGNSGNPFSETDMMRGVVGYGGEISLTPGRGLFGTQDAGALAFDQAQQMDFDKMVADAVSAPTNITQEDYELLLQEVGNIQRNVLLSEIDQKSAISNLLTSSEIFHDPSSLDILGGSDAGGLLSKRIKITPNVEAGGSANNDNLDEEIDTTISGGTSATDAVIDALSNSGSTSLNTTDSDLSTVGIYDAARNAFLMSDGSYIDYNGIAGVGEDGQTIAVTDGGSYGISPDGTGKAMAEHLVKEKENDLNLNVNIGSLNGTSNLGDNNLDGSGLENDVSGVSNNSVNNTGTANNIKKTKGGQPITTYSAVGPGFLKPKSVVTTTNDTTTNETTAETDTGGTGTGTGTGTGAGSSSVTNNATLVQVMNRTPVSSDFFASDIESIKLDPTNMLNRLFT